MQNFDFDKIKGKRVMLEIQTFLQFFFFLQTVEVVSDYW